MKLAQTEVVCTQHLSENLRVSKLFLINYHLRTDECFYGKAMKFQFVVVKIII